MTDNDFMELAIQEAAKCKPEDGRSHPRVGVVVVKDGKVMATAYRGEISPGQHAEFIALEVKLKDTPLAGSTVFTTLEPCTTRNHPKIPCAERICERKVSRVCIGMLDPNPAITGQGQLYLREANIAVDLFPYNLMALIEEQNRQFYRTMKLDASVKEPPSDEFVTLHRSRGLDQWYRTINSIYWNRNYASDAEVIFSHLVEVVGGLSLLASSKSKPTVTPRFFLPKALAWWLSLSGRLRVASVENLLWTKFPNCCPYCEERIHHPAKCRQRKKENPSPDWPRLQEIGNDQKATLPRSLGGWQRMFNQIYPAQHTEDFGLSFARLTEELGELAEAIRAFESAPGYFVSEAADVFAWLMHIQNILDQKEEVAHDQWGLPLEESFCRLYPDCCKDCASEICMCPPILPETIGRIGKEVPDTSAVFMLPERAVSLFQTSRRGGSDR